jgi:hypothetical protein
MTALVDELEGVVYSEVFQDNISGAKTDRTRSIRIVSRS